MHHWAHLGLLSFAMGTVVGCATSSAPTASVPEPTILSQPANLSVPMGLTGTFVVSASGTNLQYQWSRNGSPITGATANTYTTPATVFSDSGSTFTVAVSNTSGTVVSNPAQLTVTARAPKAGDLRFQQVDAASTVNGFAVEGATITNVSCPPPGGGGSLSTTFGAATGTGFFLTNNTCYFQFEPHALPIGVTGLEMSYAGVALQNYQGVLSGMETLGFPSPSDPGSVITSLDLLPAGNTAAVGWIHSDTASGFQQNQFTVTAAALPNAVAQEGLRGHVVTAISYDGTQATFFSYGWTGDPTDIFDATAVFATLDTATGLAQQLASEGYIITATGSTQAADGSGVILIGTRVQGDTMPRPFLVGVLLEGTPETVDPLFAQGYAIIAVVTKIQNNSIVLKNYLGER